MSRLLNIKFDLTGVEEVLAALDSGNEKALAAAEAGMQEVTADLLRVSTALAPQLTGDLMATGTREVERHGTVVEGTVSFSTPYALRRHEENYKPGPITANKPMIDGMKPGRKYLEQPLKKYSRKYVEHIAEKVKEALR